MQGGCPPPSRKHTHTNLRLTCSQSSARGFQTNNKEIAQARAWARVSRRTSTALVAEVREPPDVTEPDAVPDAREQELGRGAPLRAPTRGHHRRRLLGLLLRHRLLQTVCTRVRENRRGLWGRGRGGGGRWGRGRGRGLWGRGRGRGLGEEKKAMGQGEREGEGEGALGQERGGGLWVWGEHKGVRPPTQEVTPMLCRSLLRTDFVKL